MKPGVGSFYAFFYICDLFLVHASNQSAFTFLGLNKALVSTFKYIYQTALNYDRKSTEGFSIENVILDFMGGLLSLIVVLIKKFGKKGNFIKHCKYRI
jgi:uncharacterized protein with PQ loop repeat